MHISPRDLNRRAVGQAIRLKKAIFLTAVILLAVSVKGIAAQGVYGVLAAGSLEYNTEENSTDPGRLMIRIGYDFNSYFGVGYENSKSFNKSAKGTDVSVNTDLLYLKGSLPISDITSIYLLVGYSDVELTGSFESDFSYTRRDDNGVGTGIGLEIIWPDEKLGLIIDYQSYIEDGDPEVKALNIGVVLDF